jgi:archaemetzincin
MASKPKERKRQQKKTARPEPAELPAAYLRLFEGARRGLPPPRPAAAPAPKRAKEAVEEAEAEEEGDDEPGQTFAEFLDDLAQFDEPTRPHGSRRDTIYLRPFGEFPPGAAPDLGVLADLCRAFFLGLRVVVLPPLALRDEHPPKAAAGRGRGRGRGRGKGRGKAAKVVVAVEEGEYEVRDRVAPDGAHRQLSLNDLGDVLLWKLPEDAWCVMGVTMRDIFESKEDVFCMGRAWGASRIGVFSFLRYDPEFPGGAGTDPAMPARVDALTYRAGKTLLHELGHCLGFDHCIAYDCLMNTTRDMAEDLAAPYHICPVELQKLHYSLQLAPAAQAAALHGVFSAHAVFHREAAFMARALKALSS